ncbi:alpha/beta hydrolase [Marinicella sp. S1101]|uniref:alpha/beta fold hydrolase n=1 Tax=Marinicella marina TaxID=2996016 RepID=UPI002260DAA3|nr:alpha/beta hydrolase [Marinicella marina]MCX7552724.1 alpha/beta hydrolase [Marinicella marina]MDJ1139967.1 alpha/beta hydrolase [Marinicella marina]
MNNPKTITFETRYGNIAALQWGAGNSHKMLALHGWLDNAASFSHIAPLLAAQGHEVTAIDFPGHGHSDHRAPGHNYGFIDYVMDIQAVVKQLETPVHLLCHSMGAAIAVMYAAAFPEHIKRMVLLENLGPIPPYQPGKAVESLREALKLWDKHSLVHKRFYQNIDEAIAARNEATPMAAEIIRPLVERGLCETPQGYHWRTDKRLRLRSFFRMAEAQIQEYLAATSVPTQLIIGKPRTYALQYPMFEARLESLKPDEFVEIKGDHHLHMSQASDVAEKILSFLSQD